jgi:hypothetical protein
LFFQRHLSLLRPLTFCPIRSYMILVWLAPPNPSDHWDSSSNVTSDRPCLTPLSQLLPRFSLLLTICSVSVFIFLSTYCFFQSNYWSLFCFPIYCQLLQ